MKVALLLVLAAGVASAQPAGSGSGSGSAHIIQMPVDVDAPDVSAAAAPSAIKLGSRFTLFVTATFGPGVEVNLREPMDLGEAFEITKKLSTDSARADGRRQREWQIEVYAWELGDLQVPPVAVTFTVAGRAGQVETNTVPIKVSGVLGDADDPKLLRDYAPPVELTQRTWLWHLLHDPLWLGIAAGAVVALIMIVRRLRRRTRLVPVRVGGLGVGTRRRSDMTSERALDQLLAIERSGVLARDADRKLGYAEMADVIRDYVGGRYRIDVASELTSAELLHQLARRASERDATLARNWLERCDLVKYGGQRATTSDAIAVLEAARTLVQITSRQVAA